jgi:hypothetical protein
VTTLEAARARLVCGGGEWRLVTAAERCGGLLLGLMLFE